MPPHRASIRPLARALAFTAACALLGAGTPKAVAAPPGPVSPPGPASPAGTGSPAGVGPVGGPRLGSRGVVAPAGAPALPGGVNATGWLLADASTGAVLAARNPHGRYLPASTLKTLTALTLLPRLTDRNRVVTATDQDTTIDGTRVGLVTGGKYTVDMLFHCMLMMSGNDCATALAETAGGVPHTLELMNDEARRLHADDTHASTPSGLDGPGQGTSAYDLALILRQDLNLPDFRRYNTTRQGTVPAQPPKYKSYKFGNDNALLFDYPGAVAAKNGYTDAARHTYVAAARHGQRTLIVTLMHGERSPVDMWEQAARLLDWGFALPAAVQPVGELVTPGDGNAAHATSVRSPRPAAVSPVAAGGTGTGRWPPLLGAAVVLAGLAGWVGWRRRRRARARLAAEAGPHFGPDIDRR
ncbi:MAG TPA: LPXTG cell wall anchor domain-containing protein [Mycobacteriales bacterium]|nr:LPXTG cell wall anchor domain-containing protein [Mycobacteriales bacterium]